MSVETSHAQQQLRDQAGPVRGVGRLTGANQGRARLTKTAKRVLREVRPRKSPCAIVPDPVALIGPRPGPADIRDATWVTVRREAARSPSRRLTEPLCGGEPVSLLGRPGGTDEILGRGDLRLHSARSWHRTRRLTLKMCLVQHRAETAKPNVAGAVSAKEVNSDPRATREEERILQISRCALLTWRP